MKSDLKLFGKYILIVTGICFFAFYGVMSCQKTAVEYGMYKERQKASHVICNIGSPIYELASTVRE